MLVARTRLALLTAAVLALVAPVRAEEKLLDSLKSGTPEIKTAGALGFGPNGILFVGDSASAAVFALDTGDTTPASTKDAPKVAGLDDKVASLLGIDAKQLRVNDMAVNPLTGNVFFSLARGTGPDAKPVIVKVDRANKVSELNLSGIKFASAKLPNPTEKSRQDSITHLEYVKGKVYIAGLSNEEFASTLRAIPFPFTTADKGTGIQIFHGAHGRVETASPIRTFTAFDVGGETCLMAAYTCTPLVKIPVSQLKPGEKVVGKTVAELGNRNVPLDMFVYEKGGKSYILMANNSRGVMKIPTEGIETATSIESRVADKAGLKYETIESLKGVVQLDRYGKDNAIVLIRTPEGKLNLETIELP